MKDGLIYSIFDLIVEKLKYLNLVEFFKWISKKILSHDLILASRIGIDTFIILKWIIVILFWSLKINSSFVNFVIWYLIATNLYTYFYYHSWTKDLNSASFDFVRIKRRFLNLILAISYNILCFAYLIAVPFAKNFKWTNELTTTKDALLFSTANSLTVDYNSVQVITSTGGTLTLIETVLSFIFFTIILSNSIPQIKN